MDGDHTLYDRLIFPGVTNTSDPIRINEPSKLKVTILTPSKSSPHNPGPTFVNPPMKNQVKPFSLSTPSPIPPPQSLEMLER